MKKKSLSLLTLTFFVLSSSISNAISLDDCGLIFKARRYFNPLEKMNTKEKNEELLSYAKGLVPRDSREFFSSSTKFFKPLQKYSSEILCSIQYGANPNLHVPYKYNFGRTTSTFKPIYLFIALNDLKNTELLLDSGARIDDPVIGDVHPLAFAYTKEMAELLLDHGAKIENAYCYKQLPMNSDWVKEESLFEIICSPKHDPELIPFYLDQLEEEKRKDQAQIMLNLLQTKEDDSEDFFCNHSKEEDNDRLKRKVNYLIEAGAELGPYRLTILQLK